VRLLFSANLSFQNVVELVARVLCMFRDGAGCVKCISKEQSVEFSLEGRGGLRWELRIAILIPPEKKKRKKKDNNKKSFQKEKKESFQQRKSRETAWMESLLLLWSWMSLLDMVIFFCPFSRYSQSSETGFLFFIIQRAVFPINYITAKSARSYLTHSPNIHPRRS